MISPKRKTQSTNKNDLHDFNGSGDSIKAAKLRTKPGEPQPILKDSRQHLIKQYLDLVDEYKREIEEKKRLEEETSKVMYPIASISKQDQYLDELISSIQKKKDEEKERKKREESITTPKQEKNRN